MPWNEVYLDTRRVPQADRKNRKEIKGSARVITPKILGGEEVMLQEYSDPRQPLMDWMRSKDNPYFSRAFVNRIWANYFGRGIVEPADDMNLANPPVNKELMDYLAEGFVAHGFDMKWVHREILNSDAYQRSWKPNETNKRDEKNFSHMILRRLPAEVAVDAIKQATATSADLSQFHCNIAERAIGPNTANRKGYSSYALTTFGKPVRVANCDCERTADPTLLQTLFTRNDPDLLSALDDKGKNSMGWIAELRRAHGGDASAAPKLNAQLKRMDSVEKRLRAEIEKPGPDQEGGKEELRQIEKRRARLQKDLTASQTEPLNVDSVINELFLRTLSRPPTAKEIMTAKGDITTAKDQVDGVRDVMWALLNTREFLVNH